MNEMTHEQPNQTSQTLSADATAQVVVWAQCVLTALNVGDIKSGSPLHLKLREVMIAYRASTPDHRNNYAQACGPPKPRPEWAEGCEPDMDSRSSIPCDVSEKRKWSRFRKKFGWLLKMLSGS
jgi:hypothetical protein